MKGIDDQEQKEIIKNTIEKEIVSETLKKVAHEEIKTIAEEMKRRLAAVNPTALTIPEKFSDEAKYQVNTWEKNKKISLAYGRYREMMEQLGKKPCDIKFFLTKDMSLSFSPYSNWVEVEKRNIKIGMKAKRKHYPGIYKITDITPDARVICTDFRGKKTGIISPTNIEVIPD